MPGRDQQKNRDLKRAAKSCNKITHLFKKARTQGSQDNLNSIVDEVSQNESLKMMLHVRPLLFSLFHFMIISK